MKKKSMFVIALLILPLLFALSACMDNQIKVDPVVESVNFKALPRTEYYLDETEPDLADGVLEIIFSNGEKKDVSMNDSNVIIEGFDTSAEGELTVAAIYGGKFAFFKIRISAVRLESIMVSRLPGILDYETRDRVDLTGGVIKLNYSDGTYLYKNMTDDDIQIKYDFSEIGSAEVTVLHETMESTFSVMVWETYDWEYLKNLCKSADLALDEAENYGYDSEFLAYRFRLYGEKKAIYDSGNAVRIKKFEDSFIKTYNKVETFYSNTFVVGFSMFLAYDEIDDFVCLYSEIVFRKYLDEIGYPGHQEFIDEAGVLTGIFSELGETAVSAFFAVIHDSLSYYLDITADYYSSFLRYDEVYSYTLLCVSKAYYDIYKYTDSEDMLLLANDAMLDCIYSYREIDDKTLFDRYFLDTYVIYETRYKEYNSGGPQSYDWNYLTYIVKNLAAAYHSFDDVILFYYYKLAVAEQTYLLLTESSAPKIYEYYNKNFSESMVKYIGYMNKKLSIYAPALSEQTGTDFLDVFSKAAYLYNKGCSSYDLLPYVDKIDRLYALLNADQRYGLTHNIVFYWDYNRELHMAAYYPHLVSKAEVEIYHYLLAADAYYNDWISDGEQASLSGFIRNMRLSESLCNEFTPAQRAHFEYFFGELYYFWLNVYHQLI